MFTPENSLLWRSVPLQISCPPPNPDRHQTRLATRPGPSLDQAHLPPRPVTLTCLPTIPACLPVLLSLLRHVCAMYPLQILRILSEPRPDPLAADGSSHGQTARHRSWRHQPLPARPQVLCLRWWMSVTNEGWVWRSDCSRVSATVWLQQSEGFYIRAAAVSCVHTAWSREGVGCLVDALVRHGCPCAEPERFMRGLYPLQVQNDTGP